MRARERLLRVWRWVSRFLLWVVLPASLGIHYYTLVVLPQRPDLWFPDRSWRVTVDGRPITGIPVYRHLYMDHHVLVRLNSGHMTRAYVASNGELGTGAPIWPAGSGWVIVEGDYQFIPQLLPSLADNVDPQYKQGRGWFEFVAVEGKYKGHRVRVETDDKIRFP